MRRGHAEPLAALDFLNSGDVPGTLLKDCALTAQVNAHFSVIPSAHRGHDIHLWQNVGNTGHTRERSTGDRGHKRQRPQDTEHGDTGQDRGNTRHRTRGIQNAGHEGRR